jgi:Cytochrome P450
MPYAKGGALPAVFNSRDEKLHKQLKSPIAPLFSLSNAVTYESFVNEVLGVLCHQLDERFVKPGKTFDLGNWLQYFAFDVMGTLTFSKRYGFLETGKDVNGMLEVIWNYMVNAAPVSLSIPEDNAHTYPS